MKKISKEKIINILQKEFSDVLNYALESSDRVDRYLMPRRLKVPSIQTKNKIKKELILLRDSPLQILEKLKIPSIFYLDYLGINKNDLEKMNLEKRLRIKWKWYKFKQWFNIWFKKITLGLFPISFLSKPYSFRAYKRG